MTKLKAVNLFFFQWFFVRLTKCTEGRIEEYTLHSLDLMADGSMTSRGTGETKTYQWYSLQFWILPCTGWNNNLIYLNKKPKSIKCTKPNRI